MNKVLELMTFAAATAVGGGILASGRRAHPGRRPANSRRQGCIHRLARRPAGAHPSHQARRHAAGGPCGFVLERRPDRPAHREREARGAARICRISLFAENLDEPRLIRAAPNGDIFVAESAAGRVRGVTANKVRPSPQNEVFASGLDAPFGISFYPPGPNPEWVYIANTNSVVRYPYRAGDARARGPAETVVPELPTGGHWTRDVVFSPDGSKMYVSVGSASNVAEGLGKLNPAALAAWTSQHPLGAAWGPETERADVLVFDPQGRNRRIYATGIRNCVGMAVDAKGEVWCSTNERDAIGDNVPPDYITRVKEGAFYGWPWYYIGPNEDPRHRGERPDLKDKITVPDVLLQAHSASLGVAFYNGQQFPAAYRGSLFAAEHGSWNRSKRILTAVNPGISG